jgi:hypothetical protein
LRGVKANEAFFREIDEEKSAKSSGRLLLAGKVYFIDWHYDVKLQADNHVRWDVAARLNRKQIKR